MTVSGGFPLPGFFLAVTTAALFVLATLAVFHLWVPGAWWRPLAGAASVLSVALMVLFLGPTKLVPIVCDVLVLWVTIRAWAPATAA